MANIYNMTDTWNAAGTVFTAVKMNVTNTASAAGSALIDLQIGGVSKFKVDKNGNITSLRIADTDASHALIFTPGSNLTADRTYTVTTGDANRTLDISAGDVTISAAGAALIDDANAAAQRTTLAAAGLGDANAFTAANTITAAAQPLIVTATGNVAALTAKNTNGSFNGIVLNIDADRVAGASTYFLINARSNVAATPDSEFTVTDNGVVKSDGGTAMTTPADYAEMFEWADGNPDNEDRVGFSVVLVGNQVRKATAEDEGAAIIGVVSGNPAICADNAWNRWQDKYLRDDFNRTIYEEYTTAVCTTGRGKKKVEHAYPLDHVPAGLTVPAGAEMHVALRRKLNPEFDPTHEYTPRDERPEWSPVGLMGKLRLHKGQPVGPRWLKMRDISPAVEEWLVR